MEMESRVDPNAQEIRPENGQRLGGEYLYSIKRSPVSRCSNQAVSPRTRHTAQPQQFRKPASEIRQWLIQAKHAMPWDPAVDDVDHCTKRQKHLEDDIQLVNDSGRVEADMSAGTTKI